MSFYDACRAQPLWLFCYYTAGYKAGGHSCATYIFPYDLPPSPRHLPYDSKEREIEKQIWKIEGSC
jgi:hypothetical protein